MIQGEQWLQYSIFLLIFNHVLRYQKMVEWMDNVEMAIQKVCASKVYTSAEFKREKDNFHVRFKLQYMLFIETFI